MERYIQAQVLTDLEKKMVIVAGPRQVGKTSLSLNLTDKSSYLNWDVPEDREKILKKTWPKPNPVLVLDEIHKNRSWRAILKGIVDNVKSPKMKILVTGSAKLDAYRRGGDSLQGRYHFHRLHPFTFKEIKGSSNKDMELLLKFGGFPEPFLRGEEIFLNRWNLEYRTRIIREEIVSLENVLDLAKLELLSIRLPDLIGSPLSINALREDLEASHKAVAHWVLIFDSLYYTFRISPFGPPKLRAVKKEQKLYFWNWSVVANEGARWENCVASHLLKWIHYRQDSYGEDLELAYFRDTARREVDFILLKNRKPTHLIEAKLGDEDISPSLKYLSNKYPDLPAYQLHLRGKKSYISQEGIQVMPGSDFLKDLI